MYVATTARYLGDPAMTTPQPSVARLAELSPACATQWKAYRKTKRKNFPHVWRAFLAQNPSCRSGIAIRWGYQPSVNPCGDARSGLLIDCWNEALQSGLSGLSRRGSLGQSQAELDVLSRWHQSIIHPGELHGLGQDDGEDISAPDISSVVSSSPTPTLVADTISLPTYTGPSYGPISPSAISATGQGTYQTTPGSSSATSISTSAISPLANLATALTSLFKPSASAATAKTAGQSAGSAGSSSLGGISPTILMLGGGFLLLMVLMMGMGRR